MRVVVLDHGYVELVGSWGSDESIIEAARMSTSKGFQGWERHCTACDTSGITRTCMASSDGQHRMIEGDEKLLRYLWKNKHFTPFEMAGLTIEVQAPIFVFREWHRHRTQSYNELSARYTELPALVYMPSRKRLMEGKQSSNSKQGSEPGFNGTDVDEFRADIQAAYDATRIVYKTLLEKGVSREIARIVLPVGQYSRMRASANLRNWLQFLSLRLPSNAQWEIRQYAQEVEKLLAARFPRTLSLFREGCEPSVT